MPAVLDGAAAPAARLRPGSRWVYCPPPARDLDDPGRAGDRAITCSPFPWPAYSTASPPAAITWCGCAVTGSIPEQAGDRIAGCCSFDRFRDLAGPGAMAGCCYPARPWRAA